MEEATSSAFAFWKDRDHTSLDSSVPDAISLSPAPKQPPAVVSPQRLASSKRRPPPPPKPPSPGPCGSRSPPVRQFAPHSTAKTSPKARVPVLPPVSSWKPQQTLLDGLGRSDSGSKVVERRNSDKSADIGGYHGSTTTPSKVSDIVRRLDIDSSPRQVGLRGHRKILRANPHSVPAISTGKKFLLPSNSVVRGSVRSEGVRREGVSVEGGRLVRGSKSLERSERWSTVGEGLKKKREEGSSVREDVGDGGGCEGGERRERVRESRSLAGSRRRESAGGSMKIKSSWTCYLDGPEETQSLSPVPLSPSPTSLSPSHAHTSTRLSPSHSHKSLHPPVSPTFSTASLVQSFSESFRTSTSETAHNYLHQVPPYTTETKHFWAMVDSVRKECVGEGGYLSSPLLSSPHPLPHSPTLPRSTARRMGVVANKAGQGHMITVSMATIHGNGGYVCFQCSAQLTVGDIIQEGIAKEGKGQRSSDDLWLKVCGRDEYLNPSRRLIDYIYVHNCLKLYTEVKVQLIKQCDIPKSLLCRPLSLSLPPPPPPSGVMGSIQLIALREMNTLVDSYVTKEEKFAAVVLSHNESPSPIPLPALVQTVISCVRHLCERLLYTEPPSLSEAIYNLRRACKSVSEEEGVKGEGVMEGEGVGVEGEGGSTVEGEGERGEEGETEINDEDSSSKDIISALALLREAVHYLVSLYCLSLSPGYLPEWWVEPQERVLVSSVTRSLRVKICALHQIPLPEYRRFSQFQVEVCVFHAGLPLSKRTYSPPAKISRNLFNTIIWNKWLNFSLPVSHLPREGRLCLTLHGLESSGTNENPSNRSPVAWVTQRLFDSEGVLIFGPRLLGLWGNDEADPLDSPYPNTTSGKSALLELMFENSGERVIYDDPPSRSPPSCSPTQPRPPAGMYRGLKKLANMDRFSSLSIEDERLIWTNRFLLQAHLGSSPRGLPLLLLSTPHWHSCHRDDVWAVLGAWPCKDPVYGLELLDAQLADGEVRKTAVRWLSGLHDDDLCDFLPQLVQSMRFDGYEDSSMARLLLTRALQSPRLARHLYWHLRILATDQGERFVVRYQHMLQALETLVGEQLMSEFSTQVELVDQLVAVAGVVKATRDAHRQTVLVQELQRVGERFVGQFRLPLSPSLLVRGLDIESCSFFNSNTVPLKLSFLNSDPYGDNINIIFKVGDDLRQDILILQMIKMMEKIWIRAGLDLKMITYDCVATGYDQGMLELVSGAVTLRAIQTEHGVTGSFKDRPLSNWLMRFNTTEQDYRKAVNNFTCSCAGYCVATYIMGICDRHNDNIMVKKSGHIFHIDFGKILGNAQMFGNIKRDRVPFVLTRDMAYVINDGDRPTSRFQQFVDLCCTAYNELRKHTHTILSLLSLMLPSGLAELSSADDVLYVRDALLPGRSDAEATYAFTKHIEDSLGSMATQINFFIHNLAQLKFSSPQAPPTLLTFVPQAYSIETDGKIQSAVIVAYYTRYYPETYTVYQVQVTRVQGAVATLFRRYREFDELHSRLVLCFPGDSLPNFPGKTYLPGKSRSRDTIEKRLADLNRYVMSLLQMDPRISESDVVYTFFHCLVRDEQDMIKMEEEGVKEGGTVSGRVKVHLMYNRRSQSLDVMIRHVKDLIPRDGSDSADPYVKLYLKPDPTKTTKQKTKIARRTLHPTYNETFTYKLPPSTLSQKSLELSVWDASIILNKQCLAIATVELCTLQSELTGGCGYWVELHSPAHNPPNTTPTSKSL